MDKSACYLNGGIKKSQKVDEQLLGKEQINHWRQDLGASPFPG
jgi:hypothetical protein